MATPCAPLMDRQLSKTPCFWSLLEKQPLKNGKSRTEPPQSWVLLLVNTCLPGSSLAIASRWPGHSASTGQNGHPSRRWRRNARRGGSPSSPGESSGASESQRLQVRSRDRNTIGSSARIRIPKWRRGLAIRIGCPPLTRLRKRNLQVDRPEPPRMERNVEAMPTYEGNRSASGTTAPSSSSNCWPRRR